MMERFALTMVALITVSACERVGKNEWEDLDYSRVSSQYRNRENDSSYTPPPSVIGCVDDDLYNCNRK